MLGGSRPRALLGRRTGFRPLAHLISSHPGIPSTSCADAHVTTRIVRHVARRPIHGPRAHSLAKQAAVAALPNMRLLPRCELGVRVISRLLGRGPKGEFQSSPVQSSPAPHSPAPSFPLSLRLLSPFFSPPHPVTKRFCGLQVPLCPRRALVWRRAAEPLTFAFPIAPCRPCPLIHFPVIARLPPCYIPHLGHLPFPHHLRFHLLQFQIRSLSLAWAPGPGPRRPRAFPAGPRRDTF